MGIILTSCLLMVLIKPIKLINPNFVKVLSYWRILLGWELFSIENSEKEVLVYPNKTVYLHQFFFSVLFLNMLHICHPHFQLQLEAPHLTSISLVSLMESPLLVVTPLHVVSMLWWSIQRFAKCRGWQNIDTVGWDISVRGIGYS